jgi:hypothetical protein
MEPHTGIRGYLIFNKSTKVIEAEGLSEGYARLALKDSQELLERVKAGEGEVMESMPPLSLQ